MKFPFYLSFLYIIAQWCGIILTLWQQKKTKSFTLITFYWYPHPAYGCVNRLNFSRWSLFRYSTRGLAIRQAMWYAIGFGVIFVMSKINSDIIIRLMKIFYFILLFLLFGLIFVKYVSALHKPLRFLIEDRNGAWGWYSIPGIGTFQPSEFMKIALIFISADIIDRHNTQIPRASFINDIKLFFKIGAWAIPPLILNFLQPDTGIPVIIVISLIFMLYVGVTKNYWFLAILILAVVLYFGIIYLYFNHPHILGRIMGGSEGNSYRLDRFYGWLEYEKYAQRAGYQLYNALIALGMGAQEELWILLYCPVRRHKTTLFSRWLVLSLTVWNLASCCIVYLIKRKTRLYCCSSVDSRSKYFRWSIRYLYVPTITEHGHACWYYAYYGHYLPFDIIGWIIPCFIYMDFMPLVCIITPNKPNLWRV